MLLRDSPAGPEVLMLRRHREVEFAAEAWVFPGGAVDEGDRRLDRGSWTGIDPEALAPRFGEPADLVLGYHVAGARETFEEAGLLLARHADGRPADPAAPAARTMRAALADRTRTADWAGWLADQGLVLDLGALAYHSRWITPAQSPKRFDACFFLVRAPEDQIAAHDRVETTDQCWITPQEALDRAVRGDMLIWYPTEQTLRALAGVDRVAALLAGAREQREVRGLQPHVEKGPGGWRVLHPDETGYPDERYAPGGDLADGGGMP